jgi:hypothetical protein
MHSNDRCHVRCYMGHASTVTHLCRGGGLRSGRNEWIIQWMTHKRKLANPLLYSEQWISFSYHLLPIIHADVGTSWLWLLIPSPVTHHSSSHRSRLRSHIKTPVVPWPSHLGNAIASMTREHHCYHDLEATLQQGQVTSGVPSPAWLSTTVASMTWQWHCTTVKSPRQCHQ